MNFDGNYYGGERRPAKPMAKKAAESLRKKFMEIMNKDKSTGSNKVAPTKNKKK